jgi:hypothetical protein
MRNKIIAVISTLFQTILLFFISSSLQPVHAQIQDWNKDITEGGCMVNGIPTLKCLEVVFGNILFMSNAFIILVLFIMFVMGSFTYLTSFGSPEKVKKAQSTFRLAIIGVIVYISAYLILKTIDIIFLGGQDKVFQFRIGT